MSYVRLNGSTFLNFAKQNIFQVKIVIAACLTVDLAEWIIDDFLSYWSTRPRRSGGHHFHAWCPSVTKKATMLKQNTLHRKHVTTLLVVTSLNSPDVSLVVVVEQTFQDLCDLLLRHLCSSPPKYFFFPERKSRHPALGSKNTNQVFSKLLLWISCPCSNRWWSLWTNWWLRECDWDHLGVLSTMASRPCHLRPEPMKTTLNKSSELKMTHQATANTWPLTAYMVPGVVALFCFFRPDVRTITTCENSDHLFDRGLVGQQVRRI